jgi:hypothetical protein
MGDFKVFYGYPYAQGKTPGNILKTDTKTGILFKGFQGTLSVVRQVSHHIVEAAGSEAEHEKDDHDKYGECLPEHDDNYRIDLLVQEVYNIIAALIKVHSVTCEKR